MRHRIHNAIDDTGGRAALQQRLGAKVEGIKGGREDHLIDDNLDGEGENVRRVVEVVREKEEPVNY